MPSPVVESQLLAISGAPKELLLGVTLAVAL